MAHYDFKQLSPYDFETLARDLLQATEGIRLESFKAGKDGGVDFRYAGVPGQNVIVQCKHYAVTGLAGLLRDLKKEAAKVAKLALSRYILVTSVPLSGANKAAIIKTIGSILRPRDIYGREDVNNLLGLHPTIEKQHYKLWLATTEVLGRVLHNATASQSEVQVRRIHEQIRRYVQSAAYPRALKILNSDRVVIISGQPGVGKTTLAEMLLYEHLEQGYEAIVVRNSFEEARQLYQYGRRQIFYYDDFFGATFLGERSGAPGRNEDRAILDFMAMVCASPAARLVLTTREHILQQALQSSERLNHSTVIDHRCVLEIGDYDFGQRARILYNHLHFSDLPPTYKDALLKDEFYFQIVRHEKFMPRLVEWLSSYRKVRDVKPAFYQKFVLSLLNNPSEIWRHAYEREISDAGRSVLLALRSLGGKTGGRLLRQGFNSLHTVRAKKYGFATGPADLHVALRELWSSFIKPIAGSIAVINASVLDMLNTVLREVPENALDILNGACRFEQVAHIWAFATAREGKGVVEVLIEDASGFAAAVEKALNAPHKIDLGDGCIGYTDASLEERLATIVRMADQVRSEQLLGLIQPFAERMIANWPTEGANIYDGVEAVRAIDNCSWAPLKALTHLRDRCRDALLEAAAGGCRSNELRELLTIVATDEVSFDELMCLRERFAYYRRDYLRDEIRECRSSDDFEGLVAELQAIGEALYVDASHEVAKVREALNEFYEQAEPYDDRDYTQDEMKERWKSERADEVAIREMFGTLVQDRE